MPRKEQGWITFQSSEEERQLLEQICQQTQRTKTEVLRELIRNLNQLPCLADEVDSELELAEAEQVASTTLQAVRISARNVLRAKIKHIVKGKVNAEVTLTVAPTVELVATITRTSADKLGLAKGKEVFAVIKSSSVMIAEAN